MDYQSLRKISSMFNAIYENAEEITTDNEINLYIDKFEEDLKKFNHLDLND